MTIKEVPIRDLKPYEKNAKKHDEKQIANVANSIRRFGWQQPLVIDEDGVVVIGHCRLLAAKKLGMKTAPVTVASGLTEDEIRELRIADNKTNESPWDFELLADDLEGLDFDGFDFDFELPEMEDEPAPAEEDDWDKPLPEEPVSKPGDVYQLGRHRLMCGDSTDAESVDLLMNGGSADYIITDPPYAMTAVEWDKSIDWSAFWENANKHSKENAAMMLFSAQPFTTDLICSNRMNFRYEIVWVKSQKTGFYNANRMPLKGHENICVFYRKLPTYNVLKETISEDEAKEHGVNIGRTRYKKADRCVLYGHVEAQDYVDEGKRYPCDVLMFSNWNGGLFGNTENATVHPTQKPVELIGYLVQSYSNNGDTVLDLFGGSGSTLIACEQTDRQCRMMELDPHYVDVIIQRWEKFTGEKAVKLNE